MKVLLTGGSGLLGLTLLHSIPNELQVWATYHAAGRLEPTNTYSTLEMDIRDRKAVIQGVDAIKPDVIIHTASIGNVDYCETHQDEGRQVNVAGTRYLVRAGEQYGSRFIYTSTNAVFDGEHAPYGEEDPPHPIHFYGQTKFESEQLIEASQLESTIIRPILMYGWNTPQQRPNFVTWLLNEFLKGHSIRILKDVYCNPLPVFQCADAIWTCLLNRRQGCFHIAGRDRVSMYEFGLAVADVFEQDASNLQPVSRDEMGQLVRRPADTTYRTDKMESILGLTPLGLREGLVRMREKRP